MDGVLGSSCHPLGSLAVIGGCTHTHLASVQLSVLSDRSVAYVSALNVAMNSILIAFI